MSDSLNHHLPSIPGYTLTESIYVGSRTAVYRALTVTVPSGKPVVIKVLRSQYPSVNELIRLRNHYFIAQNLTIPGIVKPLALESWNHGYALVMEDVGGINLRDYLHLQGRLSMEQVMVIALQLADSLHHLNQNRVLHKDIKPANILIHSSTHQVWLTDFKLASLLPKESQELQSPHALEGTLAYIAPEQTGRMNRGIDYRADFYSLGVTLYELLTGVLPFQSDDPMELIHCHIAKSPPLPVSPSLPHPLFKIVLKLMAKNAEDRYQSALGLKHDLQQCLNQWTETGTIAEFELGQEDRCDRFFTSEKLYGREMEIQTLLDAFERVSQGSSELMLVEGSSGIGKTAVVNEVHKPITQKKGYFIKGKFDQFNRNIPFSAFVQAFRNLMGQLLGESNAVLADWRAKILAAIGESAQVLIEVIPELALIIGEQPTVPELSGSAAQNRFNLIFSKFIRVFTSPAQPLVIFLDDLQWIDSASLKLFKRLMDDESGYLLVLGAYRNNEVFPTHPLMQMLDEIKTLEATLNILTLEPLIESDIEHLVADTLHYSIELVRPLAQLIHQKTQGNPFFATQFLQGLYGNGWISFDGEAGYWQYDLTQVRQLALTDDVVAFMIGRLRQLPTATQEILKLSACIGNHFDLQTLAVVCECSQVKAAVNLWPALQMGLIVPISNAYKFLQGALETIEPTHTIADEINISYRFLHDCVQQSAYALVPQDQKSQIHYHLGQLLTREISGTSQETRIFELVTHLNCGAEYITVQEFRDEVAQLNLKACQRAKRTIAYQAGYEYATIGLSWLGSAAWERQYDVSLQLYNFAAEFAWLCGDLEIMDSHIETILQQSQSLLDKISAFRLRIQADTSQMKFVEALTTAQHVFELLKISLPSSVTPDDVSVMVSEIEQILSETTISDLASLPMMEQQYDIAIIQIISQIIPAAYICGSPLFPVVVISGVKLLVRTGNSPLSAYIYANYAYILCNYCQEIETSEEFGQLALRLANEPDAKSVRPQVYAMLALYMQHRKSPLRETLDLARQGYIFAQEVGNQEWAGYSAYAFCANGFASAQNLIDLERKVQNYWASLVKINQIAPANWCQIYRQTILNLTNPSSQQQTLFFGNPDQEAGLLADLHKAEDLLGLYHFHLCKLVISYLFGDIESAHFHALEARARIDVAQGTVGLPVFYFYDSLVLLSQLAQAEIESRAGKQKLQQIENNQNKLRQDWSHYAPVNYQHKFKLVQAEKLGLLGERWAALELYDEAIAEAKAHGYFQEEALANELAARFYLGWNKEKIAAGYMQNAYYGYSCWSAKAKTNNLEQLYPDLLQPILRETYPADQLETLASVAELNLSIHSSATSTSSSTNAQLDFAAVLKASQLLSEKVQLDELLPQLIELMLQNSGADQLAVVLPNNDNEWQVRAVATAETTQLLAESLANYINLPIQLLQYTKNTQEIIVIDELDTQLPIIDAYLQQHQPCSVLCLPILHQGNLSGLLYLQNQSIPGVFSRDRITVLNFLCTQAAISLTNAQLYEQSQANAQQLAQSLSQLQASETRFRNMAANVPGVIYQFYMTAAGATSILYASPDCHAIYGVTAEAMMAGQYSFWDFVHSEDRPTIEQLVAESAQGLQPFDHTFRIITYSDELKWVHVISRPSQQSDGAILWDGVIMDISDRKQAERLLTDYNRELEQQVETRTRALQESEERLRLALSTTNQGFFDLNLQTDEAIISPEYALMLGYDPATFQETKETWKSRLHPDDRERTIQAYRAYENGYTTHYKVEFRLQTWQGDWKWILSMGKFIEWNDSGKPTRLLGTHTDISDRKQTELALQNLIAGTAASTGPDFFPALVRHIADALQASHAFVTEVVDGGSHLHYLAAWADGEYLPNDTVEATGTTCLLALKAGSYHCERDVIACFPENPRLAAMGVESYMGVALKDRKGQSIGTLCIFARQAIVDPKHSEQILRVFGARAAAELERLRATAALEQLNQELEQRVEQRTQELARSEQDLRTIFNNVYDGIMIHDLGGTILDVNDRYVEMLGATREEILASSMTDFTASDTPNDQMPTIIQQAAGGKDLRFEWKECRLDNGTTFDLDVSLKKLMLGNRPVIIASARDISDRKHAERALQLSEARATAVFTQAAVGIFEAHLSSGKLMRVNDYFCKMLGYSHSNLLKKTFMELTYANDLAECGGLVRQLTTGDINDFLMEQRFIHQNGSLVWVLLSATMVQMPDGDNSTCLVVVQNISDRKAAEQALYDSQAQFRRMTENVPGMIYRYVLHPDGEHGLSYVSSQVREIYELEPEVVLQNVSHLQERIHYDDRAKTEAVSKESAETLQPFTVEHRLILPEKGIRWIQAIARPEQLDNGDIIWDGIALDITDRKQLEQEQERLTAVLEATPDFIGIANTRGEILWHNKPLRALRADLGDPDEHRSISNCHPDWANQIIRDEALPTAMQQGSWSGELALLDGEGNEIPVSQVIIAHKSSSGRVESFSTIMRDIRAIKRTEAALKLSEAQAQAIFTQAVVGFAESDLKTRKFIRVNDCFCHMLGYTSTELTEMTVRDITHPEDIPTSLEAIRQLHNGEIDSLNLEKRYIRKDGTIFWAATTAYLIKIQGGETISRVGLIQDISEKKRLATERQHAALALQLSEARASAAFEQAAVGIAESNMTDGKITRTNNYFCQMTGYTTQELESLTAADLTYPEDRSDSRRNIQQLYTGEIDSFTIEKRYLRKDGSYFWATTAVTLIHNPVEDSPRCLAVVQDISDRKHYEQQLQDLSERLELAIESAQIGIWEWSSEDNRLSWDKRMFEIYGVRPEEFNGTYQDWENRVYPEDLVQYKIGKIFRTQNNEKDYTQEFRIFRPDNTIRYILATALIERDAQGQPIRIVGTNLDITARKATELALQDSERRYASLAAVAPVAIFRMDKFLNCVYVNDRWSTMTGRPVESALGRGWLDAVHPDERDEAITEWTELYPNLSADIPVSPIAEGRHLRPDGTINWHYIQVAQELDNDGNLVGYVGTLTDITDRKQTELALEQEVLRRTTIFNTSSDAIHIIDIEGNLMEANASFLQRLGYTTAEAAHLNICDWDPQITREKLQAELQEQSQDCSKIRTIEALHQRKDGTIFPVEISICVMKWNRQISFICIARDISDRKQAEEQLRQTLTQLKASNNELESFAYSVSHDLRAPLRAINGFSQALLEDYGHLFDEQGQDYFARVRSNTNRMGQLIDNLLQLSRLSRSELRYSTVDLSALAQEVLHDLQASEPDRQVEIILQPGATVIADAALMQVVLMNLLQNAWKFTNHHATSRIEFGVLPPDSPTSLGPTYFVKDDGAGFDMTYSNKLFGVFQRLHSTTEFPGTGIGLASVRRAIHRHGGRVWAEAAIEQGATIFFTLPSRPTDDLFETE